MLHLMVEIDGQRVALPADAVEAVVELGAVTPVPRVAPHVLGLAALRSRVLTVIDSRRAIGLPPRSGETVREAVIVQVDGYSYGLTVDAVEDVADGVVEPLGAPLGDGWADVADGLVPHDGRLALRVDPAALVRAR